MDSTMVAVPIDFFSLQGLPVDAFLRMNSDKFVHVLHADSPLDSTRLRRYKAKDIHHFYLKLEEYQAYSKASIAFSTKCYSNPDLPAEKRFGALTAALTSILTKFESIGVNEVFLGEAKLLSRQAISLFGALPVDDLLQLVNALPVDSKRHTLATYMVSIMVARQMGKDFDGSIENLAIATLLHDVGEIGLDPDLLKIPISKMDALQLTQYQQHVFRSVELIRSQSCLAPTIIEGILDHHERADGSGFPAAKRDSEISQIGRIIGVADEFVGLSLHSPRFEEQSLSMETMKEILFRHRTKFNKFVLTALAQLVISANQLSELKRRTIT